MNDYARSRMSRRDGHHGGYGEYRGNYEGYYGRGRDYADYDMRDGRRGVKGTGPYGIGGRRYYGDRAMGDYDYDYRMDDYRMDDYRMDGTYRDRDYAYRDRADMYRDGDHYMNGYLRRDYAGSEDGRFTEDDMMTWKRNLRNEDGTMGEHYRKEQVDQIARQVGVNPDEFGMGVFCMATNMMYSDYCTVAKKYGVDRPEFYGDMAKAFLKDKDYKRSPEDKLYSYYKCIVEE